MKCLVLAAGYATRLYPLTENFPKPLLKVGEKTILDWLVDDIESAGLVDGFVIISNHKFADHFRAWADNKCHSERSEGIYTVVDDGTSTNETRLGAVRDIQFAVDSLGLDDDLLVIAGDNILDFSLVEFIRYAQAKGTSCIMRYYEADGKRLRKCGVVEVDGDDRVVGMEEKPAEPKSHWCCPPFYFYRREDAGRVAEGIAAGCGVDAPGSFAAWLSSRVPVHAMEMPGRRFDIGDIDSYRRVCDIFFCHSERSEGI
ncbi:MAG: nucleotidyltransferase family protein [Bacteroidales bacterium]|nr:nucleotidyltransferase family protein [Bacteroidales bacterium]